MKHLISLFIVFSGYQSFAQIVKHPISKIEYLDSVLLGQKIKKAIKILELDSNWQLIQEPAGIIRGIRTSEIEGYEVQLIVDRISFGILGNNKKIVYRSKIRRYKIIGISWTSGDHCRSIGNVLPQFAYGRFGGCE